MTQHGLPGQRLADDELRRLLTATSDRGDDGLPSGLQDALAFIRKNFSMDVVFVSRIAQGRREFVCVDTAPGAEVVQPGMSDPIEESWCHRVVEGRLPELIRDAKPLIASGQAPFTPLPIGTHLSVPIRLPDGRVYGTLCAFSLVVADAAGHGELQFLKGAARYIGDRFANAALH